jgi:hypothetical protein
MSTTAKPKLSRADVLERLADSEAAQAVIQENTAAIKRQREQAAQEIQALEAAHAAAVPGLQAKREECVERVGARRAELNRALAEAANAESELTLAGAVLDSRRQRARHTLIELSNPAIAEFIAALSNEWHNLPAKFAVIGQRPGRGSLDEQGNITIQPQGLDRISVTNADVITKRMALIKQTIVDSEALQLAVDIDQAAELAKLRERVGYNDN